VNSTPSNTKTHPAPSRTLTSKNTSTTTTTPTAEFTLTPSPFPTTSEQATIEAFDSLCTNSKDIYGSSISPNDKWIAAACYSENGEEISPLQIVSMDHTKTWKIYYRDFAKGNNTDDRHDTIVPYRWSKDGRFLYATASSRLSGCCWVGRRYVLLIRINLQTGEQVDILNATNHSSSFPFDFIISDSERYLIFVPPTSQPYDFAILDLLTWETQAVSLKSPRTLDLYFAVLSPDEKKLVLQTYEWNETLSDFEMDSIILIDLRTNEEKLLVSGLSREKEFYPVQWLDDTHVLLNTVPLPYRNYPIYQAEDWIINIITDELVKAEKP